MPVTPRLFNWTCRDRSLELGRTTRIMGVLNVTPDSFSDGGKFDTTALAVERGLQLVAEGADILDVGGESTRPGSVAVSDADEIARVLPVIKALQTQTDALISIDTSKASVARIALDAGAHIINDVSAFREWDGMVDVAKTYGAGVLLMHMQGQPTSMQDAPSYQNVVREVVDYLADRRRLAVASGLSLEQFVLDPGIGFGKTLDDNLTLLRAIPLMVEELGPIMIGLSRKNMLGALTDRAVDDRLAASLSGLAWAVLQGAHIIRVHDVKESCDSVQILDILKRDNGHCR